MPILLNVNVRNKIAKGDGQIVVCDNSDYIVNFDFDSEWDEFNVKTMRLVFSNGEYNEVVFTGNQCDLPVIQSRNGFSIGVYAGNIHTTVSAWFDCAKSILTDGTQHGEPTPDVYAQIIEMIESGMIKGDPGNGIDNIELISTVGRVKTYRITFTDGTHFDYDVTDGAKGDRGAKGDTGAPGRGISSASVDAQGYLFISYTDGDIEDVGYVKGDPGVGITRAYISDDPGTEGDLILNFSEGPASNVGHVVGADGADGESGADGADGQDGVGIASIVKTGTSGRVDTYTITFTNGETTTFTVTNGAPGVIQGVKINGTALTPDANGIVDTAEIGMAVWKKIKFSDLTWSYDSSGGSGTFGAKNSALYDRRSVPNTIISSKYKSTTRTGSGSGWYLGYYGVGQGIYVRDTAYGTDPAAFVAAHGNDYFYYLE